jgi:Tfp pilus assembly protein PilE
MRGRADGVSHTRIRGHSLIELMIATALGVLLVGAAALLYRAQREATTLSADAASIRDAGMTALLMLGQQIEMAGFVPAEGLGNDGHHPNEVDIEPAVFGCDSGIPASDDDPSTCLPVPRASDAIVVRYVDDGVATWKSVAGQAGKRLPSASVRARHPCTVAIDVARSRNGPRASPSDGAAVYRLYALPGDVENGGYALEAWFVESGPMRDDACGTFVLDATGKRSNRATAPRVPPNAECWSGR